MLKEQIIEQMKGKRYRPSDAEAFVEFFSNYDREEVLQALKELKEEYVIMESGKGNLILASTKGYFTGVVTGVFDEHIFVKIDKYDHDLKITKSRGDNVLPKDKVLIHLSDKEEFVKVLDRKVNVLVGEVSIKEVKPGKYEYSIIPQSKKLNATLKLTPEQCKKLVNGHKVVYEIKETKWGLEPVITKVIGYKDDPRVDILSYVIEAEAPVEFSEACIREANEVSRDVNEDDFKEREDYTDRMIFTIDGDDAKDFDDAVETYKTENGWRIGVHIADVSAFVKEGGAIDTDVLERGTSIYLIYSVIPMLPQILSNGVCSLVPNENRLTMSFIMDIDHDGNLLGGEIKLGIIKSKKRFTYKEVNKIVEQQDPEAIARNSEFVPMLNEMMEASKAIRGNRDRRGQLELDIPEAKVLTDENGHATDVVLRYRGMAEKAIEDYMILTNEFVASTFYNMNIPFMYRVHEGPGPEKIERFMNMANGMGQKVRKSKTGYHSHEIRQVLEGVDDEMVKSVLSSLLLRSLPKAYYGPENIGHFGLASDAYDQVTSPIRRLPDLISHRLIKKYMFEPEKFAELNFDYILEELHALGESTSMQERRAEQLERDVTKMKMAEYMEDHIGEVFKGKISGFVEKGMFIQLPNMIEGFIKFEYMPGDIYVYDKDKMIAYGKHHGDILKIGQEFEIRVARASKRECTIDFAPTNYKPKKNEGKNNNHKNEKKKGRR